MTYPSFRSTESALFLRTCRYRTDVLQIVYYTLLFEFGFVNVNITCSNAYTRFCSRWLLSCRIDTFSFSIRNHCLKKAYTFKLGMQKLSLNLLDIKFEKYTSVSGDDIANFSQLCNVLVSKGYRCYLFVNSYKSKYIKSILHS